MSTQLLLERMRKLREEREHAVAVSTAATGASVTCSVSAVAAASSPQGTGNKIGDATSSSKETGPLGRNSTPTSTMQGLLSIPPAFTSPSGSVLLYRDVHTDPLCIPFTSSAAVDLLERLVGIGRGGEHTGQKHLRDEACLSGRQRAVDYFFPSVRAKQEGALSPTPPLEQNAPNELVSTLYTDAAYKELCADATVDVSGAPRSVCRNVNHFHRRDRIAHGVYGVVFSATEPNGSDRETVFALKHIKKQWLRESQVGFPPYLLREFDLLLRLRHPNIVAAREVVLLDPHPLPGTRADSAKSVRAGVSPTLPRTTPGVDRLSADEAANSKMKDVFVVMEHCPYDLKEYMFRYSAGVNVPYLHLSSRNHHPDAPQSFLSRVKCIALQLFRGLSFLHDHRILHRDLKTSNILINREGYVKICDFGLGRLYREGQPLTPTVVTLMYRAPELHLGMTDYSHAMDVWSLGCIIAELFLKKPLFRATDDTGHLLAVCDVLGIPTEEAFPGVYKLPLAKDALRAIGRWNRVNKLAQIFQDSHCLDATLLPPSGLDLLQRIFQWCPLNRLTAAEALQHPFFTEAPHPCAPSQLLTPMPSAVTVASGAVQPPIVSRVAEGPTPPPPCVTERKEITDTGALGNGSQPGAATSPMRAPYDLHRGEDREKNEQFQSPTVSISARDEVVRHQRSTEAPSGYGRHSPLSSSEGTASEGEAERVAQQAKLLANQDIEDE